MNHLNKILVGVLLTLCSCEDFFDKAELPSDILTDKISSNAELEKLTVSAYWAWQGRNLGIGDLSIIIPSFTSDEGEISSNHDQNVVYGDHDQLYLRNTWNNGIPYLQFAWQSGYQTVRMANTVINHLNEHGPFNDAEILWADRMKGECYFNRAFAFYSMVKIFAPPYDANGDMNVPAIICDTVNFTGPFDTGSLYSIEEVYQQIIKDLENAIDLLPEEYREGIDPLGYKDRAKRDAARFLLARVYFQMGSELWKESLEQIDVVLANEKYPLHEDPVDAWNQTGQGNISSETIFQYASYGEGSAWRYPRMFHFFGGANISGGVRRKMFYMNDSFRDQIDWNITAERNRDGRFRSLFVFLGNRIWADKWKSRFNSVPMMRAPELHLTRATICLLSNLGGGKQQAIEDLNTVRKRAYGADYVPLDESYSEEDLLDIAHKERKIELFFEGDRLYYLQALREDIPAGVREDQPSLPYNSERLYWSIPEKERNTNNNID